MMSIWSTLSPIHINTNIIHILIFPSGHYRHHCIEYYKPDFSPFQSSTFPSTLSLLNFVHIKIHSKRKILIFICLFLFYYLGVWDTFFTTLSIIITHSISLIFNIFKNNIFPSYHTIVYSSIIILFNFILTFDLISKNIQQSVKFIDISTESGAFFSELKA